jgi:hypothetical protein
MVSVLKRLARLLPLLFGVHLALGAGLVLALLLAGPITIGAGEFDGLVRRVETTDFRWWLLAVVALGWLAPVGAALAWRRATHAGLAIDRVRELVGGLLQDRSIPVTVDLRTRLPVRFDQPLRVPVELHTKVAIDQELDIEAEVPFKGEIPIDTEVETSVLRFGTIRVPIRTRVPVDVLIPFKARVRIRAEGIPVDISEEALVRMPPVEVPIDARLESRIDLLANLRHAEDLLRKAAVRFPPLAPPADEKP